MTKSLEIRNQLTYTDKFFSDVGWYREPIFKTLGITKDIIITIFPKAENDMSLTAFINGEPIGQCTANKWEYFISQVPVHIFNVKENKDKNVHKLIKLQEKMNNCEKDVLLPFMFKQNFAYQDIAHVCGLMVLNDYAQKGIGTKLVAEIDKLLVSQGYKVAVVETSNMKSRKTFEKNGYVEFAFFALADFGIDFDDRYSIMYKIF